MNFIEGKIIQMQGRTLLFGIHWILGVMASEVWMGKIGEKSNIVQQMQ